MFPNCFPEIQMIQLLHYHKGGIAMNKQEINTFIETMEKIGDIWTPELVNDLFGSMSLEDALKERQSHLEKFVHTIFSF